MCETRTKSGIAAVVGRANVGKSTLINRMMAEKVSIVSPVPQTTRNQVRAVLTDTRGQLVVLDTPGMHRAEHDLGRIMNRAARKSTEGTDVVLLVLDGTTAPREEDIGWMRRLSAAGGPAWVVAENKSDMGTPHRDAYEAALAEVIGERGDDATRPLAWVSVSAATGDGVDALVGRLFDLLPEGAPLFDEDILTDFPRNWTIADVVREKLYGHLHDEIPHCVAVAVDKVEETDRGLFVDVEIYVDRPSQKGIVIGRKGRLLKNVTREAEQELSAMFDQPVKLHPWVKIERHWARNFWLLKKMGYG